MRITQQDVDFFKENGYFLHKEQLFSASQFERLNEIFNDQLAMKGDKLSDELDRPHQRDERLLDLLLSKEVLDLVEPFIGPNIGLWSSHFICKDPYVGRATPWHEDSAYWKGRVDRFDRMVTVWLALDRSNKDNGCMRVVPCSHLGGFLEYEEVDKSKNTFGSQIKSVNEEGAIDFELEPGQCSLHDPRIIHGAKANTSPFRRCGYTMRYFSTELKINPERNQQARFWLARGKDIAGNSYVNV